MPSDLRARAPSRRRRASSFSAVRSLDRLVLVRREAKCFTSGSELPQISVRAAPPFSSMQARRAR